MAEVLTVFDTLPTEILDSILDGLGIAEWVNLTKTSPTPSVLHAAIPRLYGSPENLNCTMLWACKNGESSVVRQAVTKYGADPSEIIYLSRTGIWKISTLCLTTKRNSNLETFSTLLNLGASLLPTSTNILSLKKFKHRLMADKRTEFFDLFVKAQVKKPNESYEVAEISQVELILHGTSLDTVKDILSKQDADSSLQRCSLGRKWDRECWFSPLSAAVAQGSEEIFDKLMERGANIHISEPCHPSRGLTIYTDIYGQPLHIPIFAAAKVAAETGDVKMLQKCVQADAYINHLAMVPERTHFGSSQCYTTPFILYVTSISSWGRTEGTDDYTRLVHVLDTFEVLGALRHVPSAFEIWAGLGSYSTLACIRFLLVKWGLEKLAEADFIMVLRYLVEESLFSRENVRNLLLACILEVPVQGTEGSRKHRNEKKEDSDFDWIPGWKIFVCILLERHDIDIETKNEILKAAILGEIEKLDHAFRTPYMNHLNKEKISKASDILISQLIDAGADINMRAGLSGGSLLFETCKILVCETEALYILPARGWSSTYKVTLDKGSADWIMNLFERLIKFGADVTIKNFRGNTPIDLMKQVGWLTRLRHDTNNFDLLDRIVRDAFIDVLNGKTPAESFKSVDEKVHANPELKNCIWS